MENIPKRPAPDVVHIDLTGPKPIITEGPGPLPDLPAPGVLPSRDRVGAILDDLENDQAIQNALKVSAAEHAETTQLRQVAGLDDTGREVSSYYPSKTLVNLADGKTFLAPLRLPEGETAAAPEPVLRPVVQFAENLEARFAVVGIPLPVVVPAAAPVPLETPAPAPAEPAVAAPVPQAVPFVSTLPPHDKPLVRTDSLEQFESDQFGGAAPAREAAEAQATVDRIVEAATPPASAVEPEVGPAEGDFGSEALAQFTAEALADAARTAAETAEPAAAPPSPPPAAPVEAERPHVPAPPAAVPASGLSPEEEDMFAELGKNAPVIPARPSTDQVNSAERWGTWGSMLLAIGTVIGILALTSATALIAASPAGWGIAALVILAVGLFSVGVAIKKTPKGDRVYAALTVLGLSTLGSPATAFACLYDIYEVLKGLKGKPQQGGSGPAAEVGGGGSPGTVVV